MFIKIPLTLALENLLLPKINFFPEESFDQALGESGLVD